MEAGGAKHRCVKFRGVDVPTPPPQLGHCFWSLYECQKKITNKYLYSFLPWPLCSFSYFVVTICLFFGGSWDITYAIKSLYSLSCLVCRNSCLQRPFFVSFKPSSCTRHSIPVDLFPTVFFRRFETTDDVSVCFSYSFLVCLLLYLLLVNNSPPP